MLIWLPPNKLAKQVAANAAMRLNCITAWKYRSYARVQMLDMVDRNINTVYTIPEPAFDAGVTTTSTFKIIVYTF